MRILWVATKPPVPPVDGGRLVALTTLQALMAAGLDVTVVAPTPSMHMDDARRAADAAGLRVELVAATPRSWGLAVVRALVDRVPVTIARHTSKNLQARVDALLAAGGFDVVHAEQVQAFAAACHAAKRHGVPIVWRAQNVESEVWAARATRHAALRIEVRRLGRHEGLAVARAAKTLALTARDAHRLWTLGGGDKSVLHAPAPFPAELPPGAPVTGAPAIVLPGSAGWALNDDANAWFTRAVWPLVATALPHAHLHVFGGSQGRDDPGTITRHPAPAESRDAFPAGAIVIIPLRAPAGVRMRILEAWARRLPVVATTAAAAGLDGAGAALMTADDATAFASSLAALAADPARRAELVAAGSAVLRARHDPAVTAATLIGAYRSAVRSARR